MSGCWVGEAGLTGRMTPVGGVVVTVSLFAVAVAAVFGADDVGLLECRAGGAEGRRGEGRRGDFKKKGESESKNQKSTPRLIQSRAASEGPKLDVAHGM